VAADDVVIVHRRRSPSRSLVTTHERFVFDIVGGCRHRAGTEQEIRRDRGTRVRLIGRECFGGGPATGVGIGRGGGDVHGGARVAKSRGLI